MLTAYTVDREDVITEVNDSWDGFALANGGAAACAAHIVGARLFDSITGDAARMFMTAILMRVRVSGQAETVPYRCDSDTERRYYTMTLSPLPEGAVQVIHDLDRQETGDVSVRIRPAEIGALGVLRCSICCRLKLSEGWVDPFDGTGNQTWRVVHTVCPDCRDLPMKRLRARREAAKGLMGDAGATNPQQPDR
jgi:hypothetical protein